MTHKDLRDDRDQRQDRLDRLARFRGSQGLHVVELLLRSDPDLLLSLLDGVKSQPRLCRHRQTEQTEPNRTPAAGGEVVVIYRR